MLGYCFRSFLVVYFTFASVFVHARPIEWSPELRPPIRAAMQSCATFLAPAEPKVNDSVGVLLSTSDIHDFESQLDALLAERGETAVIGGHFFITGVGMGKEKETRDLFEQALKKRDLFRDGTSVTVMSIPTKEVKKLAAELASAVLDRIKYFFPSLARDYQHPLGSEVTAGILSDIAVEVPNVVFLYSTLSRTDAHLTVATHTVVLLAYMIYGKFIYNWLLRPATGKIESLLKGALLSVPFILNYSVFGNFSKIAAFYQSHGIAATAAAFPAEFGNFLATQGVTTALQVLFYQVVIFHGLGKWQNSQEGTENSNLARMMSNIIRTPILAFDAIALAMAGANSNILWSMGPMDINSGHLALGAMTIAGSILYLKPTILDPTLHWYKGFRNVWTKMVGYFRKSPTTVADSSPVDNQDSTPNE